MIRLLTLLFLTLTLVFSEETSSLNTSNKNTNKIIKAAMPASFLPNFYLDKNNQPKGFAVEVFKEVAKNANIDYEIVVYPTYVEIEKAFKNKEIDLIILGGITQKRKEISLFTKPLYSSRIKAFKLKQNDIENLDFIDDKRLTLKSNNASVKLFKDYPKNLLRFVNSKEEGLVTLLSKESEVFVFNEIPMILMLEKTGFDKVIEPFGKPLREVELAIRIQKENSDLHKALNDSLVEFKQTKYYKDLFDKFVLGKDIEIKKDVLKFTKEELEYLNSKEYLTTHFLKDYKPFLYEEKNEKKGFFYDLVNLIGEKLNKDIRFVDVNSTKEYISLINENKIDFASHYVYTPARAKKNLFSKDFIINAHIGLVTNYKKPLKLQELRGKKLGVLKGYHFIKILEKNYPKIVLVEFDNSLDMLKATVTGKIDGGMGNFNVLEFLSKENFFDDYLSFEILNNEFFFSKQQHMVFNKENTVLKSIFDKVIQTIPQSQIQELKSKWNLINKTNSLLIDTQELAYLKTKKEFDVCARFNQYPLSGTKDGKLIGISGKIFDRIQKDLNVNFKVIKADSHEEFLSNIENNRCDLVSDLTKDYDELKNIVTTNKTIIEEHFVALGSVNIPFTRNIEQKKDITFIVNKKVHKKILEAKYPNVKVEIITDENKIMKKILENESYLYFGLSSVSDDYIKRFGFDKYKVVSTFEEIKGNSSIGVNITKVPVMLSILDKTLNSYNNEFFSNVAFDYKIKSYNIEENYNIYFFYALLVLLVITIFIVYRNILLKNEQAKTLESNKKLETLLELSTEGIAIIDSKGKLIKYSQKARKNLGYSDDEMKSITVFDWDKDLTNEEFKAKLNELDNLNKKVTFRRTHTRKDGSEFLAEINAKHIELQGEVFYYTTVKDITVEETLKSQLLEEKNKAIDAKNLAESQKAIIEYEREKSVQAYEEAKVSEEEAIAVQEEMLITQESLVYANEAKSEFLANMSHEIRTPLSGIIGVTDIMLEEDCTQKQRENLQIIKYSSTTLKNIINDVLDFSKIQSGKFEIVPKAFSLRSLLNETKVLFEPLIKKKNIDFELFIDDDIHDYLLGDSLRITQILNNLIGNSVKFTQNGKIVVKVKKLFENDNSLKLNFIIQDTGIGIDDNIKSKIFDSFTQGELSNTKSYQGTGLGLTITKSLVDLMNGKIEFTSNLGVGTTFSVKLSLQKAQKVPTQEKTSINSNNIFKGYEALVVEDSQVNQIVAQKLLSKMGFKVDIANDGEEGVDAVKKHKYDVIFMDIQMPKMDGYEATKIIRMYNKEIPIFALSAAVQDIDRKQSLDSGMNEHLKKPIDKDELVKTILRYLEAKSPATTKELEFVKSEYDEELTKTLLETFLKQYENIEDEIKNLDKEDLGKYIHKLKGSTGSLQMNEIHELCISIEKSKLDQKLIKTLLDKMHELLNNIKEELKN